MNNLLNSFSHIELLKNFDLYLNSYRYSYEYFLEGFAIFFEEIQDSTHRIVVLFEYNSQTFSIRSLYKNILFKYYEKIATIVELNAMASKLFLRLDFLEKNITSIKSVSKDS